MLSGVSLFRTNSIGSALYISYYNYSFTKTYQTPTHRWELPVLCYHGIRGTYHYPFLGVNFSVILHDFIRNNYHKNQSDRYPFFLIMVNYPTFLINYHILNFQMYYQYLSFLRKYPNNVSEKNYNSAIFGIEVLIETNVSEF